MKFLAVVCCVLVLHALLLLHVEGLEAVGKYDGMKGKCGNIVGTNVDTPERCMKGPMSNGKSMEVVNEYVKTHYTQAINLNGFVAFFTMLSKKFKDTRENADRCTSVARDRAKIDHFEKYKDQLDGRACSETEFHSYGKEDMISRASPTGAPTVPTVSALKKKNPKDLKRSMAAKKAAPRKKPENTLSFLETATKGRNVFLKHQPPSWLKEGEECLPTTFEHVYPIANIALEEQKQYLLQKVKEKFAAIQLPSKEGVTFQGALALERFNIDQILIETHPRHKNRYTVKIKGIDVKLRRLKLKIRRKLFFMFLQTGERKLFSRRDSQRLQKGRKKKSKKKKKGGFFKKIGKGIKKGFKKVGKFIKKTVQVVKAVVTNKVKCDGWVEAEYGKADLEASIEFTNDPKNFINIIPPKIDVSKLKINFHVDNVCAIAVKFKGKGKIINMIKGKVEKVLNDKIPELEKKVETFVNEQISSEVEKKGNVNPSPLQNMCDGWIEGSYGKADVGTSIQFTSDPNKFIDVTAPKIDSSKLNLALHFGNNDVCGVVVKLAGKAKLINGFKKFIPKLFNSKLLEFEKKVENFVNEKISSEVKKNGKSLAKLSSLEYMCDGWIEAGYGKADVGTSIQFTNDPNKLIDATLPKIDGSKVHVDLHFGKNDVCGVAQKLVGKEKLINGFKAFIPDFLNSKLSYVEKKVEDKLNALPVLQTFAEVGEGYANPVQWVEEMLGDKCFIDNLQRFINVAVDFREFWKRLDEEGDRVNKVEKGDVTNNYLKVRREFLELEEEKKRSKEEREKAIGEAAHHARKVLEVFYKATPEELHIELCNLNGDGLKRIEMVLRALAEDNEPVVSLSYHFYKLYQIHKKTNNGNYEMEYLQPLFAFNEDRNNSAYSRVRNAKKVVVFKRKDGSELSLTSMAVDAAKVAGSVLKKLAFFTFESKSYKDQKHEATYADLIESFSSKYFYRFLDEFQQLLRDGLEGWKREEQYQVDVLKIERSQTSTQKDLRWFKQEVKKIPSESCESAKDVKICERALNSMKKGLLGEPGKEGDQYKGVIRLLLDLSENPGDLYVNVYSPSVHANLLMDWLTGKLAKQRLLIKGFEDILSKVIELHQNNTELVRADIMPFVKNNFKNIFNSYGGYDSTVKRESTWLLMRNRMKKCREEGDDTEGKCFHWSDPCLQSNRAAHLSSGRCLECTKKDVRCRVALGSEIYMKDEIEPKRPWNTPTKLTPLVIADRALDFSTSMPQRIENTYQACSIKESKDNVQAAEGQCPGLALPEPNLFKLFRRKETARFRYWWDELRIKVGNEESTQGKHEFDDDAIWKSAGESLDGFKCAKDCENCYGKKGYLFPNAAGYKLSAIPVTSTYSADGTEIPWIREENWDKEKGFYRPRCECEKSYTEDTKQRHVCKGQTYSDNTMVCELVRNGGILNGCNQGRFVVSGIGRGMGTENVSLLK